MTMCFFLQAIAEAAWRSVFSWGGGWLRSSSHRWSSLTKCLLMRRRVTSFFKPSLKQPDEVSSHEEEGDFVLQAIAEAAWRSVFSWGGGWLRSSSHRWSSLMKCLLMTRRVTSFQNRKPKYHHRHLQNFNPNSRHLCNLTILHLQ